MGYLSSDNQQMQEQKVVLSYCIMDCIKEVNFWYHGNQVYKRFWLFCTSSDFQ